MTLHHIALNVALEDFESEKIRLEGLGLKVNATTHEWLHVRSLYFPDPERCPEPVEGGIYWSLSVTMQARSRGNSFRYFYCISTR